MAHGLPRLADMSGKELAREEYPTPRPGVLWRATGWLMRGAWRFIRNQLRRIEGNGRHKGWLHGEQTPTR